MMFKKFTTINGKEVWINIDHVELIHDYIGVLKPTETEKEKYSILYLHTEQQQKAYIVKGEADEIISEIYNSRWRWSGNGR